MYQLKTPSEVFGGDGSIKKIQDVIKKEEAKKVLLFTDKTIRLTGMVDRILEELKHVHADFQIYDELVAEPGYQDMEKMVEEVREYQCDLIIALGGGSVMDAAKLYSLLKDAAYTVKDLMTDSMKGKKRIKSVMIPTTCGTGSEATCNSIVGIPEENTKQGIVNPEMIPDYVILDGSMIRGLPKHIVASSGVDALAHAVECYTSLKATPLSDTYALASAKLIFNNIREAYQDPENMEAKNNMMLGAFYGGTAISGSGTTAVHALAYPLGGKYHIPHGVSNAILFAHVMEVNKYACQKQLVDICNCINPELIRESNELKAQHVINEIKDVVKVTEIPTSLDKYGISGEDLEFLVQAGSQQKRLLNNNRKELSISDIRCIYEKVLF
ncbi:MAG: iron-containing alcohol dehydrogenase [Lachnospiraceae bacterium]